MRVISRLAAFAGSYVLACVIVALPAVLTFFLANMTPEDRASLGSRDPAALLLGMTMSLADGSGFLVVKASVLALVFLAVSEIFGLRSLYAYLAFGAGLALVANWFAIDRIWYDFNAGDPPGWLAFVVVAFGIASGWVTWRIMIGAGVRSTGVG